MFILRSSGKVELLVFAFVSQTIFKITYPFLKKSVARLISDCVHRSCLNVKASTDLNVPRGGGLLKLLDISFLEGTFPEIGIR